MKNNRLPTSEINGGIGSFTGYIKDSEIDNEYAEKLAKEIYPHLIKIHENRERQRKRAKG